MTYIYSLIRLVIGFLLLYLHILCNKIDDMMSICKNNYEVESCFVTSLLTDLLNHARDEL